MNPVEVAVGLGDFDTILRHEDAGVEIFDIEAGTFFVGGIDGKGEVGIPDVDGVQEEFLFEEAKDIDVQTDAANFGEEVAA